MNWDDHRYFLAIARQGSLTGAASALGVSQPTMSRRLRAMEDRFGARLFERTTQGYALSDAGTEIFATVAQVEEDLAGLDRRIQGLDRQLSGCIRFTCTEALVNLYLTPHFDRFVRENPGIELSIVTTFDSLNLGRGDADVAVRFTNSPPETLVGRRLAKAAFAAYASPGLAQKFEDPEKQGVWLGWQYDSYNQMLISEPFPQARFRHRVDSMLTLRSMAQAGCGIAVLPCYLADPDPSLVRVVPQPIGEGAPDIWVLSHPSVRRADRVRLFTEFISNVISADRDLFEGRARAAA